MSKVTDLYTSLSLFSVFRNIISKKPISDFMEYCEENDKRLKLKKYGSFVSEIYKNGGNLAGSVRKLLFEDENVYVTTIANKGKINSNIKKSVDTELNVLSDLCALTSQAFKVDMGISTALPE